MTVPGTCSACGKPVNPKSRYCPHCGHENRPPVPGGDPFCPRCRVPLEPHDYRQSDASICPECRGLWLDRQEFNWLASERSVYRDESLPRSFHRPALQADRAYLSCVRCGTAMTKQNFKKISGIIIDVCGDHGVWLDAGEMEAIRAFIAHGGLDRAQDREIITHHTALKELAAQVDEAEFTQKILHFWDFKYWLFKFM